MLATASADSTRAHEQTVRLSPRDLPVEPVPSPTIDKDAQTVRARPAKRPTKPLPKAISAFDGKTMRLPPIDLPVVGKSNVRAVLAAMGFAVVPMWAGLIATVALAPCGEDLMFPLNPATVTITLVGHLIFGLVLGLAFLKAPSGRA